MKLWVQNEMSGCSLSILKTDVNSAIVPGIDTNERYFKFKDMLVFFKVGTSSTSPCPYFVVYFCNYISPSLPFFSFLYIGGFGCRLFVFFSVTFNICHSHLMCDILSCISFKGWCLVLILPRVLTRSLLAHP